MSESIEIKSLKIKLGEKEIGLTIEEAKKLKESLDELFKKEIVREVKEIHHHNPYRWIWNNPAPILTPAPMPLKNPIWCSMDEDNKNMLCMDIKE